MSNDYRFFLNFYTTIEWCDDPKCIIVRNCLTKGEYKIMRCTVIPYAYHYVKKSRQPHYIFNKLVKLLYKYTKVYVDICNCDIADILQIEKENEQISQITNK